MKTKAKPNKYIVTLRFVATQQVICEDCTEEDARDNPYLFSVHEMEPETFDHEVIKIEVSP